MEGVNEQAVVLLATLHQSVLSALITPGGVSNEESFLHKSTFSRNGYERPSAGPIGRHPYHDTPCVTIAKHKTT